MSCVKDGTLVLYARVNDSIAFSELFPKARDEEVRASKNEKVRREKYLVWKLLERGIKEHTSLDFANLQFTKTENGQWICPDVHFSLSHTDGAICVAVSRHPVGVDIEMVHPIKVEMCRRFLSNREAEYMDSLPEEKRELFFLEAWVKKESLFKRDGKRSLMPKQTDTLSSDAALSHITLDGAEYLIALSSYDNNKCEIRFTEEI